MREIKFRAWNEAESLMYQDIEDIRPRYKIHLMQFTGLKDRHGKEIYEGDIVRLHCFDHNLITATIEWIEYKFVPRIHDKKIIVDGGSHNGQEIDMRTVHSWSGMHSCFSFPSYIEIIGNIYENPELIND